jgi:hypothetical protein
MLGVPWTASAFECAVDPVPRVPEWGDIAPLNPVIVLVFRNPTTGLVLRRGHPGADVVVPADVRFESVRRIATMAFITPRSPLERGESYEVTEESSAFATHTWFTAGDVAPAVPPPRWTVTSTERDRSIPSQMLFEGRPVPVLVRFSDTRTSAVAHNGYMRLYVDGRFDQLIPPWAPTAILGAWPCSSSLADVSPGHVATLWATYVDAEGHEGPSTTFSVTMAP